MPRPTIPILSTGPFENAPPVVATTISIRPSNDATAHKVTKVTGYADGGFALLAPYHTAQSGVLTKRLVDYTTQQDVVSIAEMETFSASDRVKLSYKPDGFVQFSGESGGRIASGRDPLTLEPKGVGIMATPMSVPVITGPAFGITVYGLSDFVARKRTRGDSLVFGPEDFVYDHCDEDTWGAYNLSFFIFGGEFQPHVCQIGPSEYVMPLWHNQYHDKGRHFVFKVVRLGQQRFFLGVICLRIPPVEFGTPSGWIINGPGGLAHGPIKEVIHAFYPADHWPSAVGNSVDLEAWRAAQDEAASSPEVGRDYGGMIERAEANFALSAARDVPKLGLLRDGAGLLAEIMEGPTLVPADLETQAGATRIAAVVIATNAMRAARGCAILLRSGYTREALAVLERLKSAHRLVVVLKSDRDGSLAQRFIDGSDLADVKIPGLEPDLEAITVMGEHVPQMTLVEGPSGSPQRGFGFVGPGNKQETERFALIAAAGLVDIIAFVGRALQPRGAPTSLIAKHDAFRTTVKAELDSWASERGESEDDRHSDLTENSS
jgi:hypothetical protein